MSCTLITGPWPVASSIGFGSFWWYHLLIGTSNVVSGVTSPSLRPAAIEITLATEPGS